MSRYFNGTNQYLNRDSTPITNPPFSIALWFRHSAAATDTAFSLCDLTNDYRYYMIETKTTALNYIARSSSSSNRLVTATAGYAYNTWNHALAIEYSASSRAVYLNGGNKGTNAQTATLSGINRIAVARLGRASHTQYFCGRLAEIAMWNATLTDAEAAILALGYSPKLIRPASLVCYWPLIGNLSPEIDIVGNYDVALGNAPTKSLHPPVIYASAHQAPAAGASFATIRLNWTDVSEHEDSFSIERSTDAGAFGEIDTVAAGVETYDDIGLALGHTYNYRVRAISAALGNSDYSNEADVTV